MKCKECKYWQDFSDHVMANISQARGPFIRNRIELRRCSNVPPPSIECCRPIWTDEDYSCSGFQPK